MVIIPLLMYLDILSKSSRAFIPKEFEVLPLRLQNSRSESWVAKLNKHQCNLALIDACTILFHDNDDVVIFVVCSSSTSKTSMIGVAQSPQSTPGCQV